MKLKQTRKTEELNIYPKKNILMIIWFERLLWKVSQLWKDPQEYPLALSDDLFYATVLFFKALFFHEIQMIYFCLDTKIHNA